MSNTTKRAIGIARVSREDGRNDNDRLHSLNTQRASLEAYYCEANGFELLNVLPETDVSGGAPIEQRPGLREALRMVEAGEADIVAGAYLDRLFRSVPVQIAYFERVEAAGGEVHSMDLGRASGSGMRLPAGILGLVNE